MWLWFRDHVLPGVLIWLITGAFPLGHWHLWRKIKRLTDKQTAELKGANSEEGDQ